MSELGEKLIKGLNECLEYEQGKRHDLRTFTEVVFCKDCKYWLPTTVESLKDGSYINQKNPCEINCIGNKGEWRKADDFCSRGEKKDD